MTATMDLDQLSLLPSIPIYILRSSTIGGAFIERFLGPGVLPPGLSSSSPSALPLHPFAIAGIVGMLSNALALLPLGSKFNWTKLLRSCLNFTFLTFLSRCFFVVAFKIKVRMVDVFL
jgi:hypothetical protein